MTRRSGVTLCELLLVAGFIGAGIAVSIIGGERFGLTGYFFGFLAGVAGSVAAFAAFGLSVGFTVGLLAGNPEFPECSNGKCRVREGFESDYRYEMIDGKLAARCKCGVAYFKTGRRFLRLNDDGSLTKYMVWKPFRGWFADEE